MQGTPLTTSQKNKFIKALVSTGGNVSKACQVLKMSRAALYEHRKNDADFALLWDEALDAGVDDLEEEARRRAVEGTSKPIYQKGGLVGYVQEYSDSLLMFLLKGKRPEIYRERMDINQNVSGGLSVNIENEIDNIYGDGETKTAKTLIDGDESTD